MFDIVISDNFFSPMVETTLFSQILTTQIMVPSGHMENVFHRSHPSSPFPPPLPHSTQLQLPDAGDRVRLANRRGVEMGDRVRPNQTGGSSLGHQGLFPWAGPPKIDRQDEYCQKGLRV